MKNGAEVSLVKLLQNHVSVAKEGEVFEQKITAASFFRVHEQPKMTCTILYTKSHSSGGVPHRPWLNFTCATSAGVARGSPPPTPLKSTKAKPSCTCPPTESTMLRSRWWTTECNSIAMLTRRKASTPRRSRGVLVLSPSQHCARVGEVHLRYCGILD